MEKIKTLQNHSKQRVKYEVFYMKFNHEYTGYNLIGFSVENLMC